MDIGTIPKIYLVVLVTPCSEPSKTSHDDETSPAKAFSRAAPHCSKQTPLEPLSLNHVDPVLRRFIRRLRTGWAWGDCVGWLLGKVSARHSHLLRGAGHLMLLLAIGLRCRLQHPAIGPVLRRKAALAPRLCIVPGPLSAGIPVRSCASERSKKIARPP